MARRSSLLTLLVSALGAACVLQFALQDAFLSGNVARRDVLSAATAGIAALGGVAPAMADWQGEPVRITQFYGPQILKLKDSVDKGDLEAVARKLNKFDLFAKGAYKNQAAKQAQAVEVVDKLAEAIENKNKAGMKSAYSEFLTVTSLNELFKGPPGTRYHMLDPSASMASR